MKEWYSGTFKCSRIEDSDDGGKQRACCIVYDAVGQEASLYKPTERSGTAWTMNFGKPKAARPQTLLPEPIVAYNA